MLCWTKYNKNPVLMKLILGGGVGGGNQTLSKSINKIQMSDSVRMGDLESKGLMAILNKVVRECLAKVIVE